MAYSLCAQGQSANHVAIHSQHAVSVALRLRKSSRVYIQTRSLSEIKWLHVLPTDVGVAMLTVQPRWLKSTRGAPGHDVRSMPRLFSYSAGSRSEAYGSVTRVVIESPPVERLRHAPAAAAARKDVAATQADVAATTRTQRRQRRRERVDDQQQPAAPATTSSSLAQHAAVTEREETHAVITHLTLGRKTIKFYPHDASCW